MDTRHPPMDTADDAPDPTLPRLRRRGDGTEYLLGEETLVGRGLECDILISDSDSISRRHAQVSRDGEGLFVADLGSTNGTHLNGTEVTDRTALADGDVLAFDEYEFDVVIPPPPPPPDPEATRVITSDDTFARGERTVLAVPTDAPAPREREAARAEPAPDDVAAIDPSSSDGGGDPGAWPSPSVADEMGDDRTWPEIEEDPREPVIEFPDEPPGRTSADGDASDAGNGPLGHDPVALAPDEPDSSRPFTPEPPREEVSPAAPPPADPPKAEPVSPEPVREEPAPAAPEPVAKPARADVAAPPPDDGSGEAAVPGAWANAADVQGSAGHTMIVKYVAPRRKAPPPIDPESLDGPALVVGTDDPEGEILPLDDGITEWIVGSGQDSDLYIDDDGVSKRHAVLTREGNKWRLCDELSANGTYVNGNRLNIGYVGDGDALRFGSVECRLAIPKGGRGKAARGRVAPADRGVRPAGEQRGHDGGFPWKPVVITLAVVLVLALGAAAAFFLISRA